MIDAIAPVEWKWMNPATALMGVVFSAGSVAKIQWIQAQLEAGNRRVEWAFHHSLLVDHLTIYFYYLFLGIAALSILTMSPAGEPLRSGKVYSSILFSAVGMMCMVAGFDTRIIFGGLGLLVVSACLLIKFSLCKGQRRFGPRNFILFALPLYSVAAGFCLLYVTTGNTNLQLISQALKMAPKNHSILHAHQFVFVTLIVVTIGLSSCIAAMPFHRWLMEMLEMTPSAASGFIFAASQAASWGMLLRLLLWGLYSQRNEYVPMFIIVAVLSMIGGTIMALAQASLPRILGYAAIAQSGFTMLGLVALASATYPAPDFFEGFKGLLFSIATYSTGCIGCFALIGDGEGAQMAGGPRSGSGGLFHRDSITAISLSVALLSLAGFPLSAGWYGKYFIVHSLFSGGHYVLAGIGVLCSLAGLYWWGRLIQLVFLTVPATASTRLRRIPRGALAIVAFGIVIIGVYPRPLIEAVEWSLRLT